MRRRNEPWPVLFMCCLTVWLTVAPIASAQSLPTNWQALSGPGGRISHLTASPDGQVLYAVSVADVNRRNDQTQWHADGALYRADAIYHSIDAGATWQPTTNDLPPGPVSALYLDPEQDVLYAAVQGNADELTPHYGLWRSSDPQTLWEPVTLDRNDLVIKRVLRSVGGESLLLGVTDAGESPNSYIYSMAADGRWTPMPVLRSDQQPGDILADLIIHPTAAQRLFITTAGGDLYVSTDAGQTWSAAQISASQAPNGTAAQLAFSPDNPNTALLIRSLRPQSNAFRVEQSTDGGLRWRQLTAAGLPSGGEPHALAALPGGIYLLNTTAGTFRSADGGKTWHPLEGALSSGGVSSFLTLRNGGASETRTLAATGFGVFVSRDAGAIWQPLDAGLPFNGKIAGLLTHPSRPEQIFAISDNRTLNPAAAAATSPAMPPLPPAVLRSLDGGKHWAPAAQNLPDVPITAWAIDPVDPDVLLLASTEHVCLSTDAGVSWQVTRLAFSQRTAIAFAPSDTDTIYVAGRPASRSTDHGATWQDMPILTTDAAQQTEEVTALAVHPGDSQHLWAGLASGVYESRDGGRSWQALEPLKQPVRWLTAVSNSAPAAAAPLYAGVTGDGIYRWDGATDGAMNGAMSWASASSGLPAQSSITAFVADAQSSVLWAARDGGGIYRSTDGGASWTNAAAGMGDNLAQALAIHYAEPGAVLMGTATAGVWKLTAAATPAPSGSATPAKPAAASRAGIDARIEIVWPHDWAPVAEAQTANIGLRLFAPGSLEQPACNWRPQVTIWQAVNTAPAAPLALATQRTVDGQPFPYWELNDVDVSSANPADPTDSPGRKLYFMVRVEGVDTATSIWAHGADSRTYLPQPEVPSGVATGAIDAVDARIQIVWPHDGTAERPITEATLANVSVTFFKHGTRLSVPLNWRPSGASLFGAWNQEVGKPLADQAEVVARQSGVITYPTWEFNNIPVARAADPRNKLYLWVNAAGVQTYPTIWAHGADSRTFFPVRDEPIQGCVP